MCVSNEQCQRMQMTICLLAGESVRSDFDRANARQRGKAKLFRAPHCGLENERRRTQ